MDPADQNKSRGIILDLLKNLDQLKQKMNENYKTITNAILIGELPPGNWDFVVYQDKIVLVCPEHEPRIIVNGKMSLLDLKNINPEKTAIKLLKSHKSPEK